MKRFKVIINYSDLSTPHLLEQGRNSVAKMSSFPQIFAQPQIPYSELLSEATHLENAYNAAQGGNKQQSIELKQVRASFENTLRKQAEYVNCVSDGDELIVTQSGFDVAKQPIPATRSEFSVENGEVSGSIDLRHKTEHGVKSWLWQLSTDPNDESKWTICGASTQASFTVEKLVPGTRYWFRSAGISSSGQSEWCEPISKIVI